MKSSTAKPLRNISILSHGKFPKMPDQMIVIHDNVEKFPDGVQEYFKKKKIIGGVGMTFGKAFYLLDAWKANTKELNYYARYCRLTELLQDTYTIPLIVFDGSVSDPMGYLMVLEALKQRIPFSDREWMLVIPGHVLDIRKHIRIYMNPGEIDADIIAGSFETSHVDRLDK